MTSVFRGRFDCKIDQKGRLSIPSAFRQAVSDPNATLVITNSQYQGRRCLDMYTLEEWEALEARIAKLPSLKAEVQAYQRFYLSGGQVVQVDKNNRILVPSGLRKYAGINEELVLVGMGKKVEVWPASVWEEMNEGLADNFDSILNAVASLEEQVI